MKDNLTVATMPRKSFIKHYLGGYAMNLNPNAPADGIIEDIDMEDGSVNLKNGERCTWYEGNQINPAPYTFKDLTDEHVKMIIDNIVYQKQNLNGSGFKQITQCFLGDRTWRNFRLVMPSPVHEVMIDSYWNIAVFTDIAADQDQDPALFIDNPGQIFMLLCDLGYDVANYFNR